MPGVADFERALASAPTIWLRRRLVRMIPRDWLEENEPPDFLFTSGKPNRFNPDGVNCVYFSQDDQTAGAEYLSYWSGTPAEYQPRVTYFARVNLHRVLDLTQPATQLALGFKTDDLHQPWRLARSATLTQMLGAAVARQARVSAIRYPSDAAFRAGDAGANVVVFRNSVRKPDRVDILGPNKKSLQSWP